MTTPIAPDDDLMTAEEVARFLSGAGSPVHKSTVYRWAREKRIPPPLHIGLRLTRWKRSEITPVREQLWKTRKPT